MMPRIGLDSATTAVDTATPMLHMELPVKVKPKKEALSPMASLKRKTK